MFCDSNPRFSLTCGVMLLVAGGLAVLAGRCPALTLYDFGNPNAEEQLYLEMINRARADPVAEGLRLATTTDPDVLTAYQYFGVNLTLLQNEFNALPAQPPLAPNACLATSARSHSAWMLANGIQSHNETNPVNDPFSRMAAAGYSYTNAGENIYASTKSVWFGHVGFQVDWGPGGTGGMLEGRGHRTNIHSVRYREIGAGVVLGSHGSTGPQLITQDFGTSSTNPTLTTGVAYYDLNSNNFYDVGEGICGLTVNVSGADVTHYCTTATGGGWVVPVPATAATRAVTFSGLDMNQTVNLIIPAAKNAKADLKLGYVPPVITSAASADEDHPHTLTFNPVGGATGYLWNRWTTTAAAVETCETIANITASTTGSYSVLTANVRQQGSAAFHLENTTAASQWLQLNQLYYGQAAPSLSFQSRIRYATTSERFKVQIKEEGSLVWQDVFSQTGSGGSGESAFNLRTADLTAVAGKAFRIRFLLNYGGGGYYNTSGDAVGWFIDAITFNGVAALGGNVRETLAGTSGCFTPTADSYLMSVAPLISGREFPASYQKLSIADEFPTAPQITTHPAGVTIHSGDTATFTVTASGTSPTFEWYAGTSGVTTSPIAGATGNSFTTPPLTSTASYWVRAVNPKGSDDSNTVTATVTSDKTDAAVELGNLAATYNGSPKTVTATTTPAGLPVKITYNGSAYAPRNAGTYAIAATINHASYQGGATGTLVISKATASITLGKLATTFSGSAKRVTATTKPSRLAVILTYDGSATAPSNAGTYTVVATINHANYQGQTTGTLVISKANASIGLTNLKATYNGSAKPASATTKTAGVTVNLTYDGSSAAPVNAGRYAVVATIDHANYQGRASGILVISKATATPRLSNLTATYDGSAKTATATTTPAGLTVNLTYNGSATAPINTGRYAVVATISDANYQGRATATLVINKASTTPAVALFAAVSPVTITTNPAGSNSTPASYAGWAGNIESANGLAAGTIANQPDGDYDRDGRSNLIEYAFGTSPVTANDPAPRMPVAQTTATHFVLQYQRDTALADLSFTAQASPDLTNWQAPGESGAPSGFTDILISTTGTLETRQALLPRASCGIAFIRIRVTRQ